MKQRSLILLGLLMGQSQHGYMINEFIERNLGTVTDMKKSTAYATLDKLSQQGYIKVQMEQEGNRPPRKVYSINEAGRDYFYELLMENLSESESIHFNGDIGLMFIDTVSNKEAIVALQKRLQKSSELLEVMSRTPMHGIRTGVNLAVKHKVCMLQSEVEFLQEAIEQLQQS